MKRPRVKDEAHLEFIRQLSCLSCGDYTSVEAAHIRSGNLTYGKRSTGMQEKPSDKWCLPLCSKCHRTQHEGDEVLFWSVRGVNPFIVAMTLYGVSGDYGMAQEVLARAKRQVA